jgi:copper chaperone
MSTFTVSGMNCGHCTKTITQAILTSDKTAQIETDIPSKTVKVSSTLDSNKIKDIIIESGYEVTSIKE